MLEAAAGVEAQLQKLQEAEKSLQEQRALPENAKEREQSAANWLRSKSTDAIASGVEESQKRLRSSRIISPEQERWKRGCRRCNRKG